MALESSTCFLLSVLLRFIETFFFHPIEKVNIFLKCSHLYFPCIPCFVILETIILVIHWFLNEKSSIWINSQDILFAHPFSCLHGWSQIPSISRVKGRASVCRSWSSPRSHGKGLGVWEDLLLISSWPWFLGQKDMKNYMPSTQIHQIFQFVFNSSFCFCFCFSSQETKLHGWVTSSDLVNGMRYNDSKWDEWSDEDRWHPLCYVKHAACSAKGHLSPPNTQVLHLWTESQK